MVNTSEDVDQNAQESEDEEEEEESGEEGEKDPAGEEGGGGGAAGGGADKYGLEKGKEDYQKGNYEEAVKSWTRSLQSVKYILDKDLYKEKPDQLQEVYDMEVKICLNMAQGLIKTGDYSKAVKHADRVLAREPSNTKALYRKAIALKHRLSFAEAAAVLERLLQVEPQNAAAIQLLAEVRRDATRHERKEKKMSQKMFSSVARDPRVPPTDWEWLIENLLSAPTRAREWVCEILQWWRELPARKLQAARNLLASLRQRLPFARPAASAEPTCDKESKADESKKDD